MPDFTLTEARILNGAWEGILTREGDGEDGGAPQIGVTHLEQPVDGAALIADPDRTGRWHLRVPIPAALLSDGVQTFLIRDTASGQHLGAFSIALGDVLDSDIRAEVDLLRAELDMLKRAFRRHCLETA